MKQRKQILGIWGFFGLFCLIVDSKTAIQGSIDGLNLCMRTLIPSLFPFFVVSSVIQDAFYGTKLPVLRPLGRLFRIPEGSEALLIPAFLGGYPVGASSIRDAFDNKQISIQNAERMLAYCNNCGPSFLFGVIAPMFTDKESVWVLWAIHVLSCWMVANVFPYRPDRSNNSSANEKNTGNVMIRSIRSMGLVCGWVILFRVILAFLQRWILWLFPTPVQVLITGLMELSNGCCELHRIDDIQLRFFICSILLSLGGFCVAMQTVSAASGLRMQQYIHGRILHCLFSMVISTLYLQRKYFWIPVAALIFPIYHELRKKYSGNRRKAIV